MSGKERTALLCYNRKNLYCIASLIASLFFSSESSRTMEPEFEIVYTMTDYYDGPRAGIASFHGIPRNRSWG